jgi:hypothetical protein
MPSAPQKESGCAANGSVAKVRNKLSRGAPLQDFLLDEFFLHLIEEFSKVFYISSD